jgi:hypothetical protein
MFATHLSPTNRSVSAPPSRRILHDDFGVAANPVTGLASIVYSDDQYRNDPNNAPSAGCAASASNSPSCDHTATATQTSGKGIN